MASRSLAFAPASKRVLTGLQDWTTRRLVRPVERLIKVVSGQAAHDEIKAYILENEAVHTALVTRLLRAESQIRLLTALVVILAVAEVFHWLIR
jgi:hypothetical protein